MIFIKKIQWQYATKPPSTYSKTIQKFTTHICDIITKRKYLILKDSLLFETILIIITPNSFFGEVSFFEFAIIQLRFNVNASTRNC